MHNIDFKSKFIFYVFFGDRLCMSRKGGTWGGGGGSPEGANDMSMSP